MRERDAMRRGRRWAGWGEGPLEGRLLMSASPWTAEVHGAMRGRRLATATPPVQSSQATYLTITNTTDVAVRLAVSAVDSQDWDGVSRPDRNLDGVVLQPGQSIARREEVNAYASTPAFDLALHDDATGAWIMTGRVELVGQDVPMPLGARVAGRGARGRASNDSFDFFQWRLSVRGSNPELKDASGAFPYRFRGTGNTDRFDSGLSFEPAARAASRDGTAPRLLRGPRVSASQATYLTIQNDSPYRIRLGVSAVDSYDWDGVSRPDRNLDGVVLEPGQATTQREETNINAAPAFDLSLYDDATGAFLGTGRALFQPPGPPWDPSYFIWQLSPRSQPFDRDGVEVTFSSKDAYSVRPYTGTFVVS